MEITKRKAKTQNRYAPYLLLILGGLLLIWSSWNSIELGLYRFQRLFVDMPNQGILVLEHSRSLPFTTQFHFTMLNSNGDKIIGIPYTDSSPVKNAVLSPNKEHIMVFDGSSIQLIDLKSGTTSEVVSRYINHVPIWAPNSQSIVYQADSKIFIYDLLQEKLSPIIDGNNPTWAVDGSYIQYINEADIYTINLSDGKITQLTNNMPFLNFEPVQSLAWSPNGNRVAFVSDMEGYNAIYVMNNDGSEQMRLTDESIANKALSHSLLWSPDGSQILFPCRYSFSVRQSDLCLANADGSEQIILTDTPLIYDHPVTWSPDSNQIVYTNLDTDTQETQTIIFDVDTSETQLLFENNKSYLVDLHWWSNN